MNRLIIIGNGFDLAHGLPTSYRDFIDDYWREIINNLKAKFYYKDSFIEVNLSYLKNNRWENFNWKNILDFSSLRKEIEKSSDGSLEFNNYFFCIICYKSIDNWVDIENIYYAILKEKATEKNQLFKYHGTINNLNAEFEQVKNLLENYLQKITIEKYNYDEIKQIEILNHLNEEFLIHDFTLSKKEKEFYSKKENREIKNNQLLSFNYTNTVEDYANFMGLEYNFNYIHGKLKVNELPIIFGFGDEMDEDYKIIENLYDNEYLKNFKSIKYLEYSTYKYLLNYIESEPFQVFIMGHSCGLSDRTLLSTIFEHGNCLSIKVFYHQYFDKKTEIIKDNYTDIIQNISRHFNDKKMLRKKVVEKRLSKPLIEIKLPKTE